MTARLSTNGWRCSGSARAVESRALGRVSIGVFDETAEGRGGRGKDAPRTGHGGGTLDVVTVSWDAGKAETDALRNQSDSDYGRVDEEADPVAAWIPDEEASVEEVV